MLGELNTTLRLAAMITLVAAACGKPAEKPAEKVAAPAGGKS